MSREEKWQEWSPPWAPHVLGRYTAREQPLEGEPQQPQRVEAVCKKCGGEPWRGVCTTGNVRGKISTFALEHRHAAT